MDRPWGPPWTFSHGLAVDLDTIYMGGSKPLYGGEQARGSHQRGVYPGWGACPRPVLSSMDQCLTAWLAPRSFGLVCTGELANQHASLSSTARGDNPFSSGRSMHGTRLHLQSPIHMSEIRGYHGPRWTRESCQSVNQSHDTAVLLLRVQSSVRGATHALLTMSHRTLFDSETSRSIYSYATYRASSNTPHGLRRTRQVLLHMSRYGTRGRTTTHQQSWHCSIRRKVVWPAFVAVRPANPLLAPSSQRRGVPLSYPLS
jgi:hypothetical protein